MCAPFWRTRARVPPHPRPCAVSMCIILYLVINSQMSAQLNSLPIGSNGVWLLDFMAMSQMFVFFAILEYVLCNFLMRIEGRVEKARVAILKRREGGSPDDRAELRRTTATRMSIEAKDAAGGGGSGGVRVEVIREAPPDLQREVAREASRVTRYVPWLVTRDGVLRIRDQHVDVASRLVFPPVYGIAVLAFYSSIWGTHRP